MFNIWDMPPPTENERLRGLAKRNVNELEAKHKKAVRDARYAQGREARLLEELNAAKALLDERNAAVEAERKR